MKVAKLGLVGFLSALPSIPAEMSSAAVGLPAPSSIVVSWQNLDPALTLESASALGQPWSRTFGGIASVKNGIKHITVPLNSSARFFRFAGEGYYYGEATPLPTPLRHPGSFVRGPSLSSDGLTLYYSTNARGDSEILVATRASLDSPWVRGESLSDINTEANEAFPSISPDGLSLYFCDWFLGGEYLRPDNLGFVTGDIYVSTRETPQSPWELR